MMTTDHPLIRAYLDEVETGLRDIGIAGADRAEALAGLRDHVAEALAERAGDRTPTDAEVRDVLAALGPPDNVVRGYAEQAPEGDGPNSGTSTPRGRRDGTNGGAWHDQPWVPRVVAVLQVGTWVVAYLSTVMAGGLAGPTRSVGQGPDAGRVVDWARAADQVLLGLIAAALPWGAILATLVLTPVVVSVLVVLLGEGAPAEVGGWVAMAAVLLGLILALRGLTRSALART